jgi:hypothetical protein
MDDVNENAGRPASTGAGARSDERPPRAGENENGDSSIWEELRARRVKASRRIGEGWERMSGSARDYADDHSIGVALGSLGVGIALGVLIGALLGRD